MPLPETSIRASVKSVPKISTELPVFASALVKSVNSLPLRWNIPLVAELVLLLATKVF